jgi:LysM repeat protein
MKKTATLLKVSCLVAVLTAPPLCMGEDFLLYAPKPASGDQVPASPDQGVLVKSVTVKRGDTLRNLSRKHLGVPSWFPQVLLFNSIKNPDLIYPGEKLLVPVRAEHAASVKKSAKAKRHHAARRPSSSLGCKPAAEHVKSGITPTTPSTAGEQETYQRAKRAYLSGDCQRSLELFDAFLRKFPHSELAADASLYRADCYLRLSGQ